MDKQDATVNPSVCSSDGNWNVIKLVSFDKISFFTTGNVLNSFFDSAVKFSTSSANNTLPLLFTSVVIYEIPAAPPTIAANVVATNFVVLLLLC